MKHNRLVFENGTYNQEKSDTPMRMKVCEPWVYVWVDNGNNKPIYVGEFGASQRYNVLKRLRYSIGELSSSNLPQIKNNYQLVGGISVLLYWCMRSLSKSGVVQGMLMSVKQ